MTIWDALLQGIVQGLTEFLPVSSSGHLSLVQYFTGNSGETGAMFSILLHLGTLIAVFIAFRGIIWELIQEAFAMIGDMLKGKFSFRNMNGKRRMIWLFVLSEVPLLAFLLVKDYVGMVSADNSILVEGFCFVVTGILLLLADKLGSGKINMDTMRPRDAVAMGIAQGIATLPGISRSGSTVATGLLMGLDRGYAVTFSFIMGVPAVLGANILELGDAIGSPFPLSLPVVLVGVVSAVLFGLLAIKMVQWLIHTDKYKYFGYYTLALGVLTIVIALIEWRTGHRIQQFLLN
ncbi:MAG: undecaprenyl-diphosphate phosphatase [Oscillospiraceae bacterium]|nr:undecaprenyl-diphosphate phosphatase [Oscillospiraceae bacterium]